MPKRQRRTPRKPKRWPPRHPTKGLRLLHYPMQSRAGQRPMLKPISLAATRTQVRHLATMEKQLAAMQARPLPEAWIAAAPAISRAIAARMH